MRREVIRKHTQKGTSGDAKQEADDAGGDRLPRIRKVAGEQPTHGARAAGGHADPTWPERVAAQAAAAALRRFRGRAGGRAGERPLPRPRKRPAAEAKVRGGFTLPTDLDPRRGRPSAQRSTRTPGSTSAARSCRPSAHEFGVHGHRQGDPARSRGHDLRVQARRRRQVLQGGRRSPTTWRSLSRPSRSASTASAARARSASRSPTTCARRSHCASCSSRARSARPRAR